MNDVVTLEPWSPWPLAIPGVILVAAVVASSRHASSAQAHREGPRLPRRHAGRIRDDVDAVVDLGLEAASGGAHRAGLRTRRWRRHELRRRHDGRRGRSGGAGWSGSVAVTVGDRGVRSSRGRLGGEGRRYRPDRRLRLHVTVRGRCPRVGRVGWRRVPISRRPSGTGSHRRAAHPGLSGFGTRADAPTATSRRRSRATAVAVAGELPPLAWQAIRDGERVRGVLRHVDGDRWEIREIPDDPRRSAPIRRAPTRRAPAPRTRPCARRPGTAKIADPTCLRYSLSASAARLVCTSMNCSGARWNERKNRPASRRPRSSLPSTKL